MGIFRKHPSTEGSASDPTTTYPLNTSEASWCDEQHVRACDLVSYYTGDETDEPTLDQLDATVLAWAADSSGERPDVAEIDNSLGIAFGEILAEDAGLTWVIATGPQGSDLALHTADDEVVLFPRIVVAERLDEGLTGPFFVRLHGELTRSIEQGARR